MNIGGVSYNSREEGFFREWWGVGWEDVTTTFRSMSDGSSNTMFIGERDNFNMSANEDHGAVWVGLQGFRNHSVTGRGPENSTDVANAPNGTNYGFHFSSFHPAGLNIGLGDGSVHFLTETVNLDVYRQLSATADGEVTGEF